MQEVRGCTVDCIVSSASIAIVYCIELGWSENGVQSGEYTLFTV